MSDFKSRLPDFKELTSMTTKLYKGIKSSVEEIIQDYKQKRAEAEQEEAKKDPAKPADSDSVASQPVQPVEKPAIIPEGTDGTVNNEQPGDSK